jgi:hypothetical protein
MKYYLGRNDPTSGTLKMRSAYYFNGDCNDEEVQDDLKERYIGVLQDIQRYPPNLCNAETCRVENIQIHCGVVDVSRKRRRRRNIEMEVNRFQYFVCIH